MSENQGQKKKNKNKKKKKSSAEVNSVPPAPPPATQICQNDSEKDAFSINEVLPQKVGMKTVFKDVEVTMTHSGTLNEVVNGTSKKKKKKKKSKKVSSEPAPEASSTETDNQNTFFKFNDDRIELLNHPEISVTLSKSLEGQKKETTESKEKVTIVPERKETSEVTTESTNSKKKKKKKKKKKNPESNLPVESTPESLDSPDIPYTAPTYVKLPASGDSCVLLVSHESFSNDNHNTEKETTPNNGKTVLIKSKERVEVSNGTPLMNPQIQTETSVSIFPVVPESKPATSEKISEINMDASLQKVNNLIKKEINGGDPSVQSSESDLTANTEETKLSKAQLKAERRAKQEAQRAAKLAKSSEKDPNAPASVQIKTPTGAKPTTLPKQVPENAELTANKASPKHSAEKEIPRKVNIFSHLPQCKVSNQFSDVTSKIHPAILEIGSHYSKGILLGSNSRCLGFLAAFREVIRDQRTPSNKEFSRELESKLQMSLNFLNTCRPLSVSIANSVRFLKHQINHLPKEISEEKAKEELCLSINNFVKEEILLAKEAICITATAKIVNGDTILVFAYSSLVHDVLCKAHNQNKSFHVVVVDNRPKLEGLEMLERLVKHGIQCTYTSIGGAAQAMKTVSKVIIGAHALLSNGSVMSRVGNLKIAEIASYYSVPVLVCCETYKFCERALTDSFVHNELGKPEDLISISIDKNDSLKDWKSLPSLQIYNILYDVTPSDFISVVITEKGLLPCTSVPVVLRVKQAGLQE